MSVLRKRELARPDLKLQGGIYRMLRGFYRKQRNHARQPMPERKP